MNILFWFTWQNIQQSLVGFVICNICNIYAYQILFHDAGWSLTPMVSAVTASWQQEALWRRADSGCACMESTCVREQLACRHYSRITRQHRNILPSLTLSLSSFPTSSSLLFNLLIFTCPFIFLLISLICHPLSFPLSHPLSLQSSTYHRLFSFYSTPSLPAPPLFV